MDDFVRAFPVQLRPSAIEAVDEFAHTERVSRSAILRAAIELGLRYLRTDPSLLKELLPVATYGRGTPKRRKATTDPSTPEEPQR
jgi:hypothetical protein